MDPYAGLGSIRFVLRYRVKTMLSLHSFISISLLVLGEKHTHILLLRNTGQP